MLDEPVEPRRARGAALIEVSREDLELFGVDELESRIERLQDEIARTRSQLERKKPDAPRPMRCFVWRRTSRRDVGTSVAARTLRRSERLKAWKGRQL